MQSATKSFHIPSLDGIRALSFLLVFLSHAGLDNVVPGLFGVAVFFFLSGYLITTLMRLEIESTGTLSLRNFFLRRALRILPPFYLVVAVLILVVRLGWLPGSLSGADLLVTLSTRFTCQGSTSSGRCRWKNTSTSFFRLRCC
jgi:peptidoglycan/LPS O-acetylase OafA/YrhL